MPKYKMLELDNLTGQNWQFVVVVHVAESNNLKYDKNCGKKYAMGVDLYD